MARYPRKKNDAFESIPVFLPKGTIAILRQKSAADQIPVSRLCAIAVDNELDQPNAFHYSTQLPEEDFEDLKYFDEAGKLCNFLASFKDGTSLETLLLCRRDIGIQSRKALLGAYRELMVKNIIEEFTPKRGFYNRSGAKRARIKKEDLKPDGRRKSLQELEEKYRGQTNNDE